MSSLRNQGGSGWQSSGQRKVARGRAEVGSDDEVEDDFDVDVEDEGSKLSTGPSDEEMAYESDIKNPRPSSSRPQLRRGLPSAKVGKAKTSKKSRRTVISDDEDEDEDSMRWRSDMSVDEDPPSSPPQTRITVPSNTRTRKGKSRADFEDMDVLREGIPVAIGTKRSRPSDSETVVDSKPPSPPVGPDVTAIVENKEPVLKKKFPPIKKMKLFGSTASSPVPTSKATTVKTERAKFTVEGAGLPPPPSSLPRKPAATAGNADLDLLNADVYNQLFSTGNAPPKSGVKEKEERMRELHKMRDEARVKRQREAVASFNLAAQHDKIEAFTRRLEARRSPAIWPNTLAAKFKADMQEKIRAEQKAKQQQQQFQQMPPGDRKSN